MRRTWLLGAVAVAGVTAAIILYLQKRALERELDLRAAPATTAAKDPWAAPAPPIEVASGDGSAAARRPISMGRTFTGPAPTLPPAHDESRLDRRVRRRTELAALLGRQDGESAEDYRKRIAPMITTALARPRAEVEMLRSQVELKAGVTAQQHQQLDAAFGKVYDDLLSYTNGAIADGELTPYKSNVAGILEYAGGLGSILDGADTQIGKILTPDQQKTFDDSGFEWAEYLGTLAPWEKLDPPPVPH